MKRMMHAAGAVACAALFSLGAASNCQADEPIAERFELRGFAHQAYMLNSSDTNKYLGADRHGSFDLNAMALLFSFKATDDLTIWTQLYAGSESDMRLDWAFADYRLNDWLRIRGGQIKTPLGLQNETRDIKYLHLSTLEPMLYQETTEVMFEAFRGASLQVEHELAGGEIKLDLFAGAPVSFEAGESEEHHNALIGGRLSYAPPLLEGLKLGATYMQCQVQFEEGEPDAFTGRKEVYGGSLEFKRAGIELNSEYFKMNETDRGDSYYVEAGYTIAEQWIPFVRYDYFTWQTEDRGNPAQYQEAVSFGLGYRFNKYAALKVEDHIISGYALPALEHDDPFSGDKHWNLFAVSLNLMF